MQASRLLTLLMHLQTRGRVSAQVLAELTQVSVRTIYRDVDQLSAAGVPIWAQTGRHGGICLREGWRTQLTGLTTSEARALGFAALPGPAADLGLGEAAAMAQLKLLAALPADTQADAQRLQQRFHLDPTDWYRAAVPPAHLQTVAAAVWNSQRLVMRYESWERVSDQTVEPLGLVLKAGTWYMAARPAGRTPVQVRSYRMDAVASLQLLEQRFDAGRFDLAAWWRESTARFEAGLYTGTARVRVTEIGWQRLRQFSAAVAQAAADSAEPSVVEGCIEAVVPIESIAHAAREMLRLGAEGEVLAPPQLRAALAAAARAMLQRYQG